MNAVANCNELSQVEQLLNDNGYEVVTNDDNIATVIVLDGSSYPVSISIIDDQLKVVCQLGTVGEFLPEENEENAIALFANLLATNATICPFAVAILSDNDDDDLSNDPVVLMDSVPMGDLCPKELLSMMDSLRKAIIIVGNQVHN